MFAGGKNLDNIYHYINGFLYSNLAAGREEAVDLAFKNQFHEWVKSNIEKSCKLEFAEHRNYVFYISQVCHSEEERLEKFFELCEEFFQTVSK